MPKEKAYLVSDDYLIEVATRHVCNSCFQVSCPKDKIELVRFLWKDTGVTGPRMGSYLQGPGVFIDDPSRCGGLTRSLDIALQKLQVMFDQKAKTAAESIKKLEKYISLNAKELVLGKDKASYISPFTGTIK